MTPLGVYMITQKGVDFVHVTLPGVRFNTAARTTTFSGVKLAPSVVFKYLV